MFLAYIVVLASGLLLSEHLFGYFQDRPKVIGALGRSVTSRFEFIPPGAERSLLATLVIASFTSMFLELMMIRWISSEVRIFAFFKNFVLVACFFGFGMGCYFSKKKINLLTLLVPLLYLALVVKLPWESLRVLISGLPNMLGSSPVLQIWSVSASSEWLGIVLALALTAPLFVMLAFLFVPFGQWVGWCLENSSAGLSAYTVNVGASLLGILAFTVVSFLNMPPAGWFAIVGICLVALSWKVPRLTIASIAALSMCIALALLNPSKGSTIYWSPYQKLMLTPVWENGELLSYELATNDSWYQRIVNFSPQFVSRHPELFQENSHGWDPYNLPYRFSSSPASVLVLGAGMGNDVAAAVRNTNAKIVAVEIDPTILRLGKELHFERPYDSPRVRVVVDDARSYVHNSRERFDLIVYSLLDSHTTNSNYTNIRIDNYVYTVEALQEAKRLMNPDGLLIVKFQTNNPWIGGRLEALLRQVFGREPVQILAESTYVTPGRFFISGSQTRIEQALSQPGALAHLSARTESAGASAPATVDNWPYFYQRWPGIPFNVLLMSLLVVALSFWFSQSTAGRRLRLQWHFFFLGAGFLLLEVQIISKIALLFGTTWLVNAFVISTLLFFIMAANWTVQKFPAISVKLAYTGVFTAGLLAYFVPIEAYFFESLPLRVLAAMAILCSPAYFAGIVFAKSYTASRFGSDALGSNILGALCGGILESLSFWTGIRSLVLVALLFYVVSALSLRRAQPESVGAAGGRAVS